MFDNLKKIFFENTSFKQTIFKNTFWLAFAEVITGLLRFALLVYVARILGATEYGKFTFAFSFVSLFAILSDLGLSNFVTREFSKEKEKEKEYPAIILLKIFLSIGVLFLIFVSSFFTSNIENIRGIIWVLAILVFSDGFFSIIYPFVRARQKMEYEAATKIMQTILTVVAGFFIILKFPSAINLSYAYLVASLATLTAAVTFFHFFAYPLKLKFNIPFWIILLKNSWPLTFGFIGVWVYINLDSVMVGFLGHVSEVGWYNAASKIILSIILITAGLLSRSFYPALSKFFKESKTALQKGWNYYVGIMITSALPLMFGGWVFAPKIVDFLYGLNKYSPSVFVFQVLIILAGITFLYYPYSMILIIFGEQRKNFLIMLLGITINIILNFILIPKYGFYAAPINTVISNIIAFLLLILSLKQYKLINLFDAKLFKVFLISFFASLIMIFIVQQPIIYKFNLFFSILIGFAAYSILFFTFKTIATKFLFIENN